MAKQIILRLTQDDIHLERWLDDYARTGDRILFGETAPKGSANRLAPLEFLRGALCLDGKYRKRKGCARVPTEGVAHHAYTTRQGPSFIPANKDDVTIRVISRLSSALDRAARAGAISPRLPLYLTEFGIQSLPDKLFGVSLQQQLEERNRAERIAYSNNPEKWTDPSADEALAIAAE